MIRYPAIGLMLAAAFAAAPTAQAQRWCDHGYRTSVSGTIKEIRRTPAFSMLPGGPKIKGTDDLIVYAARKLVSECRELTKGFGFSVKTLPKVPSNCRPGRKFVAHGTIDVLEADPNDPEDEDIFDLVVDRLVCE